MTTEEQVNRKREEEMAPFLAIANQSRALYEAMKRPDFDGFTRLDPTLNKACGYIHAADEIIVRYKQGEFPRWMAWNAVKETLRLVYACKKRYGRHKVKTMDQAFHKHFILWFAVRKRVPEELYAKKIFQSEDRLIEAICQHNRDIIEPTPHGRALSPLSAAAPAAERRTYRKAATKDWTQKKAAALLGISERQLRSYAQKPPDAHWPGWEDPIALKQWLNQREDRDLMAQALSRSLSYRETATERSMRR